MKKIETLAQAMDTPIVRYIQTLPPLPAIVPALIEATADHGASAEGVAEVLQQDPAVAAKVLRVANSPFYGGGRDVGSVERAVVRLGVVAVRNLVIGLCSRGGLRGTGSARTTLGVLWSHSVATAAAADLLANKLKLRCPEEVFTAALLHDLGQMAMAVFRPSWFNALVEPSQASAGSFLARERERFGLDHTQVGEAVLEHWGLPRDLCGVARQHHTAAFDATAADADEARLLPIVVLADEMAQRIGIGFDVAAGVTDRGDRAASALGLSEEDCLEVIQALPARMREAEQMLELAEAVDASAKAAGVVAWVSPDGKSVPAMAALLLEAEGYDVVGVACDGLEAWAQTQPEAGWLVMEEAHLESLSSPEPWSAWSVVGLSDKSPGIRQFDRQSRRCVIPRAFGAFDLRWVKERFSA